MPDVSADNPARHVAIVGTGPAGEAAGRELLARGMAVTFIDEQARTGGNIGRVSSVAATTALEALVAGSSQARLYGGTAVLSIEPPGRLWLDDGSGPAAHCFDATILACGAYDLHHPIPGLPAAGVTSAGALQALLKGQALRPRGDVVVAGSGPFLTVVAAGLVRAGARVTHLIDRLTTLDYARMAHWGLAIPGNAAELAAARLCLLRHGCRVLRGRAPSGVEDGGLSLDDGRTIAFDHLGLSDLFIPQTQLARTAGCRLRYEPDAGYWTVATNAWGRTSVAGVFVCGEGQGIRGWRHARVSGRMAACALLADRGGAVPAYTGMWLRRRLFVRFGRALERAQRRREPVRPAPESVVCACEGAVTSQVEEAVALGLADLSSIKVVTRCGMGPCQGRYCEPLVARALERGGQLPRGPLNQRAFTRPASAGDLARGL